MISEIKDQSIYVRKVFKVVLHSALVLTTVSVIEAIVIAGQYYCVHQPKVKLSCTLMWRWGLDQLLLHILVRMR